jgi:hypothetical protein
MTRRAFFGGLVLVLLCSGEAAHAGKRSSAAITRGSMGVRGVEVSAQLGFSPPTSRDAQTHPSASSQAQSSSGTRPSSAGPTAVVVTPVFTRACVPTHSVTGAAISYAAPASTQECLLSSLAPPPDPARGRKRRGRPRPPSPEELARQAADRAISLAPTPRLRVAPRAIGLTGLPSYFWLARRPRTITATAGVPGLTVTAQARPVQFVWDFGDGIEKVTRKSGLRWRARRSGNIAHTYETRHRYRIGVEVIWQARWRLGGGAWRPLGYFSNSDSRRYRVRQVIAVLTRSD